MKNGKKSLFYEEKSLVGLTPESWKFHIDTNMFLRYVCVRDFDKLNLKDVLKLNLLQFFLHSQAALKTVTCKKITF